MCWNEKVSYNSFAIGILVSIILFYRNKPFDRTIAVLTFFYSMVQYAEANIWKYLNNTKSNLYYTKMIYFLLWSQVFAVGLGLYLNTGNYNCIIIGILLFIYGYYNSPKFSISKPTQLSNQHLVWGFDYNFYTVICIVMLYFIFKYTDLKYTRIYLTFFLATLLLSWITNKVAAASMWCWISAVLSFIPLIFIH